MLTLNYHQLHVLDYPILKLTFILYDKKKSLPRKLIRNKLIVLYICSMSFRHNPGGVHLHTLLQRYILFPLLQKNTGN
nr:MAG TPA: hypothetical protein [Caudoviricetes sp.]